MEQFKSIKENYTCILISPRRSRCLRFALLAKSVFWPISMSGPMNALVLGFIVELCVTGRSKSNDWHIVLQMVLNSYKLKRLTNASMHKKNQNWSVCSRLNRIMHDWKQAGCFLLMCLIRFHFYYPQNGFMQTNDSPLYQVSIIWVTANQTASTCMYTIWQSSVSFNLRH